MSYLLGLTGSIGMGKSTTAQMFVQEGIPLWDADATVHRIYGPGGAAVDPIAEVFPGVVIDGAVDRDVLKSIIAKTPGALSTIQELVYPILADDRARFIDTHDADILLFDIPLLLETGADQWLDGVVVVSAPADIQRKRVLERPNMTEAQLDLILSKQMSDAEKRARADWVIPTVALDETRIHVTQVLTDIRKGLPHA